MTEEQENRDLQNYAGYRGSGCIITDKRSITSLVKFTATRYGVVTGFEGSKRSLDRFLEDNAIADNSQIGLLSSETEYLIVG